MVRKVPKLGSHPNNYPNILRLSNLIYFSNGFKYFKFDKRHVFGKIFDRVNGVNGW